MMKTEFFLTKFDTGVHTFFSKKWHYAITFPGLLVLLYVIYFVFCFSTTPYDDNIAGYPPLGLRNDSCFYALQWIGISIIIIAFIYIIIETIFKMMYVEKFIRVIFFVSCVCLVCYGFTMSVQSFGQKYDTISFTYAGHWAVIVETFKTGRIPSAQLENQYYQPKLYHTLMAAFMKINSLFVHLSDQSAASIQPFGGVVYTWTVTEYALMEMNRILMAYIGIYTLVFAKRVIHLILKGGVKYLVATTLLLLNPGMWYVAFYCNNDCIALFFTLVALWSSIIYFKTDKWWSLLVCAVSIGFGMMSKTNAALIAFPIAVLFLLKFVGYFRTENIVGLKYFLIQIGVFAIVVFPLGLWCPIYYKIAYDIPIGYVLEIIPGGQTWINPNFYNPFQRYIAYPAFDLFRNPYVNMWRVANNQGVFIDEYGTIDYNIWTGYIKTLCFYGQFTPRWMIGMERGFAPLQLLLYLHIHLSYYLLIAIFLISVIVPLFFLARKIVMSVKAKRKFVFTTEIVLLLAIALIYSVGYVYFNWRYPFGVTQHSRYALPLLIPVFCSFGYFCEYVVDKTKYKRMIIAKTEEIAARQKEEE